jgi:hypothetical protein
MADQNKNPWELEYNTQESNQEANPWEMDYDEEDLKKKVGGIGESITGQKESDAVTPSTSPDESLVPKPQAATTDVDKNIQEAEAGVKQFEETGDNTSAADYGYVTPDYKPSTATTIITDDVGLPVSDKTILKGEEDVYKNPYALVQKPLYGRAPGESTAFLNYERLEQAEKELKEKTAKYDRDKANRLDVTKIGSEVSKLKEEVYTNREKKRTIEDQVNRDILNISTENLKNKTPELQETYKAVTDQENALRNTIKTLSDSGKLKKDKNNQLVFESQEDLDNYQSVMDDYKKKVASFDLAKKDYDILTNMSNTVDYSKFKKETVGEWDGFINAIQRGSLRGQTVRELFENDVWGMPMEEMAKNIALRNAEAEGLLTSEAFQRYQDAEDLGEAWEVLKQDPIEITSQLFAESMSQLISAGKKIIPATVATGAATGAGIGSVLPGVGTAAGAATGVSYGLSTGMASAGFAMEYYGAITDQMQKAGLDLSNPEDVEKGLMDEELLARAKEIGVKRGVPIALMDMLTGSMAGRIFKVGKIGLTKTQRALMLGGEMTFQAAGEGGGEALAQLSAGEGLEAKEILSEMLGGQFTEVPNLVVNIAADKANNIGDVSDFTFGDSSTRFNAMKNNEFDPTKIYGKLDLALKKGQITEAKAEEVKAKIDNDIKIMQSIPDNITSDSNKQRAFELLNEKSELSKKEKSLVGDRVEQIDNELSSIAEKEKTVKEPTLKINSTPTDKDYGTVNRHDGKGLVKLTKEEYLAEEAKLKDEEVPTEAPTEEGAAEMVEEQPTTEAEQPTTKESDDVVDPSVEIDSYIAEKATDLDLEQDKTSDDLYTMLDDVDRRTDISEDSKERIKAKIESEITKLESDESTAKTKVSETTQRATVKGARIVGTEKRGTSKVEQKKFEGKRIDFTDPTTGETTTTTATVNDKGSIVLNKEDGTSVTVDSPFLDFVESNFDNDGNLTSVVLTETNTGNTYEIVDGDLGLDIAIRAKENKLGPIESSILEEVMQEVVIQEKKPAKEQKTQESPKPTKAETERAATRTQQEARKEGLAKKPTKEKVVEKQKREPVETVVKGPKREAKKEKPTDELTKKKLERDLRKSERALPSPLKNALNKVREEISGTKKTIGDELRKL